MKRLALMTTAQFPCVRVGKMAEAMRDVGWEHDVISTRAPMQLEDAYRKVYYDPSMLRSEYVNRVVEHPGELIHVNNEPNWPVQAIKEATDKPVILNVHDVATARLEGYMDPHEEAALKFADAYVFISEEQRQFVIDVGMGEHMEGKRYCILPNFVGSRFMLSEREIRKPFLDKLGGMVYMGGADPRNEPGAWRDLSMVADLCEDSGVDFHIYPGNPGVDYGKVHGTVFEYPLVFHHMARHDWGFTGCLNPSPAWLHSVPNKVFEYLAAGIPLIAYGNPLVKPLCDAGLGIYCHKPRDIPSAARVDPKPFRKRVLALRGQFTMERNIPVLAELYDAVLE